MNRRTCVKLQLAVDTLRLEANSLNTTLLNILEDTTGKPFKVLAHEVSEIKERLTAIAAAVSEMIE